MDVAFPARLRKFSFVVILLLLFGGCGSGNGSSPVPHAAKLIFVGYFCFGAQPSSVRIFAADANGSAAPLAILGGDQTGITAPAAVALDRIDQLYVANAASSNPAILVFAQGASGNVAPMRSISGSNTGLNAPFGVVVDQAGNIFVANEGASNVLKFDAAANGNVAPVAIIAGANTGLAAPPLGPLEISLDIRQRIYVTNVPNNSVLIFAPDADGNVAPIATLAGPNTGLDGPIQAVFGPSGRIYVSDNTHCFPNCTGAEPFAITVYKRHASGDAVPVRTITGSNTHLFLPAGIAVDDTEQIYAANQKDNSVQIFPRGSDGNVAPRIIAGSNPNVCVARSLAVD